MSKDQRSKEIIQDLTCSKCGEVVETYSEIVYSQGEQVCLDCKKENSEADKKAFDNYMNQITNKQ